MIKKWKILLLAVVFTFSAFVVFGCGGQEPGDNGNQDSQTTEKQEVRIGYVEWDDCIATTYVMKHILEDMGYEPNITSVDAGVMWSGVAQGEFDFIMGAWLPKTQQNYWNEFQDDVDNLGPNFEGAKIGLVVPEYVDIDSITELNENADKFNGIITGIEPGAGIMQTTENAIEEYDLELELEDSSSAAMAAGLQKAINDEKWIVVTGWNPHWKFAQWDLKYLDDPEEVYGGEEHIDTVARIGLEEDMPEVYELAGNFYWTSDEIGNVMLDIQEGVDPDQAAQEFIENNQELVDEWTP